MKHTTAMKKIHGFITKYFTLMLVQNILPNATFCILSKTSLLFFDSTYAIFNG